MTLEILATVAIAFCLLIGAIFSLVGSIGLLKFNDSMTRLHAPTKVGTVGVGALLLASLIHAYTFGEGSMHEVLIMAFLFVTAPISANFIAKVNIHRRSCVSPPSPPRDDTWSTLNVPQADLEIVESK
ncbi:Na(+)/H(+) antiporter subunit G [Roseovarius litorisediminis]|uniref:Na(+)/H(+) antiporter subunit G n=1 Tax=Roseovarius litorisediminis TaxID=1312363 RepID=A0A1Y5T3K6_9RHOB|nr:Na+/H+ antiporter subunit G [Roseovarius litorisediminis]SLN54572.1 Na(+)/H(+) antiporter subunit G [Roseovarius litorisediminis]